jgi:hypothetical protein
MVCRRLVIRVQVVDGAFLPDADPAWASAINTVVTILIMMVYVAAVPIAYAEYQTVCKAGTECGSYWWYLAPKDLIALRELGLSVGFYAGYTLVVEVFYALGFWAAGALIFWRKSDSWVTLFVSLMLVTFEATNLIELALETNPLGGPGTVLLFFGYISFFVAFYLFPDGRFVPRWTRWLVIVWVWYIGSSFVLSEDSLFNPGAWPPVLRLLLAMGLLGTIVLAQVYRYLRVSGPIERQQTKWVVFGLAAAIAGFTLVNVPTVIFPEKLLRPGVPNLLYALVNLTLTNISLLLIPLSIGVAILRYRLWDIDIIINRTLVYSALTATVIGLYLLVVGGLGTLFHDEGNLAASLVAAGVVAFLFSPLRDRLQRGVNRLMYGERDDRYAVLSRLGRRLETTVAPEAALEPLLVSQSGLDHRRPVQARPRRRAAPSHRYSRQAPPPPSAQHRAARRRQSPGPSPPKGLRGPRHGRLRAATARVPSRSERSSEP